MQKVFVLGLDGAVLDFIDHPELPNFQKVLQSSAYGTSFSRPALTPAAWTSMTTGVNPGKHGIFDFRVGERLLFATDKKALAIWENLPSVVINASLINPYQKISTAKRFSNLAHLLSSQGKFPPQCKKLAGDLK